VAPDLEQGGDLGAPGGDPGRLRRPRGPLPGRLLGQRPWHHAALIAERVAAHNAAAQRAGGLRVLLFFLPAKAPWLMPLEPVFGQTKRAAGPRQRASLAALQAAVDARLRRRNACARDHHERYLLHRLRRTSVS
jgi:hypothetical protein